MNLQKDVSLRTYSAMRLGGEAKYLVEIFNEDDLTEAVAFAKDNSLAIHTIGSGSNTIFSDEGFDGILIVNKIAGVTKTAVGDGITLVVGAGEDWDALVAMSVNAGYSDIAALSKIPGTVGAAPVQNIGAYGQQVSDAIVSIRAYSITDKKFVEIKNSDCDFSYRHSRFNQEDMGRYIITEVTLKLTQKKVVSALYKDVEHYLHIHGITYKSMTAQDLRDAVIEIRAKKLPDPSVIANCGSFFGNPVVSESTYKNLLREHPQLKAHRTDDGSLKLYAGQLIELAGMKNYQDKETGMATWRHQALVVVNETAQTTNDLIRFKAKIIANVQAMFGITLVQEPELV